MFAAKTGMTWTTEAVATVDSAVAPSGLADRGISLRVDALDAPHVAFRNATGTSLGYATKAGGSWSTTAVDEGGDVGLYPSLAFDGAGRPAIAYHDASAVDLKFARWTGTAWDVATVRSDGLVGLYASLAFDVAGRPHIASYEYNASRTDAVLVVAGTAAGKLYGIDANLPDEISRGPREKQVLSWRYRIRWMTDVDAEVHLAGGPLMARTNIPLYSPAFSPNGRLVFVGLRSAELLAVDPATGGIVWRRTIPGTTWGSAPVSFRSQGLPEDWVLAAGDDGTASLYDDAGILLASRAIAAGRLLTPAVTSDRAVLASWAGDALQVRLADLDLTVLWSERLVGAASGSIAVREEALTTFFGDETGRVYSLRYDNGGLLYRAKFCDAVSAGPLVAVPPRSLQANVWFGCRDGSLYAVSSVSAPRPVP
jgi:outer membrane protein assembly factor BamB